jgi:hypothetical protein
MRHQNYESKRLKIEKRKNDHFENQKMLLEKFREKKRETENLLRLSYDKPSKGKVNITSPENQFNDSYMKKRVQKVPHYIRSGDKSEPKESEPHEFDAQVSDKSYDGDKENHHDLGENQQIINEATNE